MYSMPTASSRSPDRHSQHEARATEPGLFSLPTNVAVDRDGNVYVTDTLNNRVEIFDADGNFISTFGKNGDGPGYFARPKGIAIDTDGHIWVVDAMQQRVQVFNNEGSLLIYFGELGGYPGQFQDPYEIAIDNKTNRVITSEQYQGRVQMFRYVTDAEAEQAEEGERGSSGNELRRRLRASSQGCGTGTDINTANAQVNRNHTTTRETRETHYRVFQKYFREFPKWNESALPPPSLFPPDHLQPVAEFGIRSKRTG